MTVFALGGFTCIISILRLQSLLVFLHNTDISWHNPLAAIWSSLEVNIGIVCSCLPTLKAMVSRYFPRVFNTRYLRGSDHSHNRARMHGGGRDGRNEASSSGSSNQPADKFSFDALGRGPGRELAQQKTTVRSEPRVRGRNGDDSLEDIEFGAIRDKNGERGVRPLEEPRGIHVVTVVEQEVEKGVVAGGPGGGGGDARSEAGSERELVNGPRRGGERYR